jgi:hypothetical protein
MAVRRRMAPDLAFVGNPRRKATDERVETQIAGHLTGSDASG